VVSSAPADGIKVDLDRICESCQLDATYQSRSGPTWLVSWGLAIPPVGTPLLLSRVLRRHAVGLSPLQVARAMIDDENAGQLAALMPPFAATLQTHQGSTVIATDWLGFRQLYKTSGEGWTAISSSARVLAACQKGGLDDDALRVQSLLGWQLGTRTLYKGVSKINRGERLELMRGMCRSSTIDLPLEFDRLDLAAAVSRCAAILRENVEACLDDHPDLALQLTGGQDSRLLLSAIPPRRRKGLHVITLGSRGTADVDIASDLCNLFGMRHDVHGLERLHELDIVEAYKWVLEGARRLDGMADPLGFAALQWAEQQFDQVPRLSGLGGEVARGFYYYGLVRPMSITPTRARRLVDWRMFANESVEASALDPEFAFGADAFATNEVFSILRYENPEWFQSTDALYLWHRMQRWAGLTDTAVWHDRMVINPMLDPRFVTTVMGLTPAQKHNSLFLSRLQMALDSELGDIPLDGRPPPAAYAHGGMRSAVIGAAATGSRFLRKAVQRARSRPRPSAGGAVLAGKVAKAWQADPRQLDPVRALGVLRPEWLDAVLDGIVTPEASTVAFILNLLVALEPVGAAYENPRL
jgi:asparagine synthase (glutamine-hydrolysing)